jgi:pimeloyl-ACP methyl ester carboxylesterase
MRGGSARRRGGLTPPGAFVDAGGARLHYVRAGSGTPLVYIHGAKGSTYDFTLSVGPRLAEQYETVAFDRPGSGFSGRPADGDNRPEAQAAVLRAAAAQLGLERPLLVGHSLGAAVALAWALDAPAEVAAVVTLGAYALPLGGPPPWVVRLMRYPALLRGVGALGRSRLGRPLVRSAVERAFSPSPAPAAYLEIAPRLALQPEALVSDGADREVAEAGLAALRPRYPGLLTPLVLVVGAEDHMVPPAVSERLHALVPRSELVRVPGAGHMPQFSAPDAVVAAVDHAAGLAGLRPAAAGGASLSAPATFASPRSGG